MRQLNSRIRKTDGQERNSRGFSREELEKAGLGKAEARKLKVPFDMRRKTAYPKNIEVLKTYVKNSKTEIKSKPKTQAKSKKKAKK